MIKFEQVDYTYNEGISQGKKALENINLRISENEFVGIIGHTGSGKSTLIQLMNGILKPSRGDIYIDSVKIGDKGTNMKEIRKKVGIVFQYPEHQIFEDTVEKEIIFGPKNFDCSDDELKDRLDYALRFVGFGRDMLEKSPFELSGGQKRRVAIASIVASRPKILVLDEPTAGLDAATKATIIGEIKKAVERENLTVVFVTHSMEDISEIASRIIVMNCGSICLDASPQEIYTKHSSLLTKIGLDIPQVTKLSQKLKINPLCHNIDDAVIKVRNYINKP